MSSGAMLYHALERDREFRMEEEELLREEDPRNYNPLAYQQRMKILQKRLTKHISYEETKNICFPYGFVLFYTLLNMTLLLFLIY